MLMLAFCLGAMLGSVSMIVARAGESGFDATVEAWCGYGSFRTHFSTGQVGDHRPGIRLDVMYRSDTPARLDDERRMALSVAFATPEGWAEPSRSSESELDGRRGHLTRFLEIAAPGEIDGAEVAIDVTVRDMDGAMVRRTALVSCSSDLLPPRRAR